MLDDKGTNQAENAEKWYQCDKCEYRVKKEMTLKNHISTKHSRSDIPEGLASNKVALSYFCDECEHACQSKRSLKKHKLHNHESNNHQCSICENNFKYKKDLDAHVEGMHNELLKENEPNICICTDTTVCDKCLNEDGWLY